MLTTGCCCDVIAFIHPFCRQPFNILKALCARNVTAGIKRQDQTVCVGIGTDVKDIWWHFPWFRGFLKVYCYIRRCWKMDHFSMSVSQLFIIPLKNRLMYLWAVSYQTETKQLFRSLTCCINLSIYERLLAVRRSHYVEDKEKEGCTYVNFSTQVNWWGYCLFYSWIYFFNNCNASFPLY